MRFLRAFLLFLPMATVGVALCSVGPMATQALRMAWDPPEPPNEAWVPALQCMPEAPAWAPTADLEWREELDGSNAYGFTTFADPAELDALLRSWGVEVEGHLQTSAYFAARGPHPALDDLIALTVFDQPHWRGPFHEHRMRAFHVVDGLAVEVVELAATLGNYHPCGTANDLGAYLTEGVPDGTRLALRAEDPPDRALIWPTATDARVARRLEPSFAWHQLLGVTGGLLALLGHLVPGSIGWLWWRRRRQTTRDRPLPWTAWLAFLATVLWVRQPVVLALSLWTVARGHTLGFPETYVARTLALPWWSIVGPGGLLGCWICLSTWWSLPSSERAPVAVGGLLGSLTGATALTWLWTAVSG